ncbi:hypothetical protein HMPREF0322_04514 [Desulfitobacterium hafniense DP7]|uniref:Uncharacterized protein n=2 Tax=Desulfitobacterium hafniense TaxID=49338 RepID=Q24N12_DESHY|nr:hypothetical protein HMPREF0322_04514 [Desulfitobacterium hafniense DP7]BAE86580.1 hypothetical protein DSY4791 [Desulfitobacterium hafniense Y51]
MKFINESKGHTGTKFWCLLFLSNVLLYTAPTSSLICPLITSSLSCTIFGNFILNRGPQTMAFFAQFILHYRLDITCFLDRI